MSLFPPAPEDRPSQARRLAPRLRALAGRGVYFGTSSWKYPGWLGSIYGPDRYMTRGKFSQKKFDETCLAEYAETFPVVGGDFAFYQFPSESYWAKLFGETPGTLSFALKVPEDLTVPTWPKHARYGVRAGEPNRGFLDAGLFRELFADRLAPHRDRVACLMFEFGTMNKGAFADAGDFLARFDPFLAELPEGFRYAVEIRNPEYLRDDYFEALARRNVAHVFNAWTRAPRLTDQLGMPGSMTADFGVARALLKRGRNYEDAVKTFEPYEGTQEVDEDAREGLARIAEIAMRKKKPAYLLVNNRLEGNAPSTIEAVVGRLEGVDVRTDS